MPTVLSMHKNAEIVRRGYQAFNAGDMKTLTELFDEKASWHTPGRSSLAGDHKGREAVFAYFGQLGQGTGGTYKAQLRHLFADDEGRVVGIHHNTAKRAGKSTKAMAREDANKPGALGKEARLAKIGMKYGGKRKKKARSSGR